MTLCTARVTRCLTCLLTHNSAAELCPGVRWPVIAGAARNNGVCSRVGGRETRRSSDRFPCSPTKTCMPHQQRHVLQTDIHDTRNAYVSLLLPILTTLCPASLHPFPGIGIFERQRASLFLHFLAVPHLALTPISRSNFSSLLTFCPSFAKSFPVPRRGRCPFRRPCPPMKSGARWKR